MKSHEMRGESEVLKKRGQIALPMARHIEHWPLDRLIPYIRNPRTHSEAQVAEIAASIVEFGFLNPILVDTSAGIIAGHGRLRAARKLQLSEVPVIVLDHLTESQKRAYMIADNRLAENAGWDDELLRLELAALDQEKFDIHLTGFEEQDLARLLASQEATDGLTDEDAIPELEQIQITVPGDMWALGEHRLLCGDATVIADIEQLVAPVAVDLIFTDPPYNVDYEGYTKQRLKISGDRMTAEQFQQFLAATFASYRQIVKPAPRYMFAIPLNGSESFRTPSRLPGSGFAVRSFGPRTRSRGVSGATNSSTSRFSMPMWPEGRIPGTGTSPSRLCGRRKSQRPTEFIRPPSRWN
jgi:ParB-like chromosome segregation protein Spo0J